MKFRNALLLAVLSVATLAMLLRVVHSVNLLNGEQVVSPGVVYVADGAPFPPLPPMNADMPLVADGAPFPPLPPTNADVQLVADGAPFPPFPPGAVSVVADGAPFPPLPPLGTGTYLVADGWPLPPCGLPQRSISADLRDLRKPQHG